MKAPTRSTLSGRAYRDLQNLARRQKRPTDELLALYALEGYLDRLSRSPYKTDFVLKGGVLLAAYDIRRPTRDIDFHARGIGNDEKVVLAAAREIVGVDRDDGLQFDPDGATAETIREGNGHSGVRVVMPARLATARIAFNVDLNVGDPVWPAPQSVKLPLLLGGTLSLRGYPLSMVFAEKIITAIERGVANTRWRDFADIYLLSGTHEVDGSELQKSLRVVADYRRAQRIPLAQALDGFADLAQSRWRTWIRKQRLTDRLPDQFADLMEQLFVFADPALQETKLAAQWNPMRRAWNEL